VLCLSGWHVQTDYMLRRETKKEGEKTLPLNQWYTRTKPSQSFLSITYTRIVRLILLLSLKLTRVSPTIPIISVFSCITATVNFCGLKNRFIHHFFIRVSMVRLFLMWLTLVPFFLNILQGRRRTIFIQL